MIPIIIRWHAPVATVAAAGLAAMAVRDTAALVLLCGIVIGAALAVGHRG